MEKTFWNCVLIELTENVFVNNGHGLKNVY